MAVPQNRTDSPSSPTNLADRVARYRVEVERVVREVGEHPQYEMKRSCSLSDLSGKIEFVKDVQSIATSRIETEKFLIIGADEKTRSFCAVTNASEFDDASIRQILERYLSPAPRFEVFPMESSDGKQFVLIVIPRQSRRTILARVTVEETKATGPRLLLREGDLWTKGTSTGKRLAKVEDWNDIWEEVIEAEANQRAGARTAHSIEMALAREKVRPFAHAPIPSIFKDDEFQALMEDICSSKDEARLKLLLERFRDDAVEAWHEINGFERLFGDNSFNSTDSPVSTAQGNVREHIKNVLRPAIRWVTLTLHAAYNQSD